MIGEDMQAVLDFVLICCVRCEANRVQFVNILDKLEMVIKEGEREDVIRVWRIWFALVHNDDIWEHC